MKKAKWLAVLLAIAILSVLIAGYYPEIKMGIEFAESSFKGETPVEKRENASLVKPWAKIELKPVASGFSLPTYLTHAGDGTNRLFVVEKPGRIKIIKNGEVQNKPFLHITSRVGSRGSEQGLLSLAFHPNYGQNSRFFVNYTNRNGDTVIAEYKVSENQDSADENSERILLTIKQPYTNHNGGQLQFGPDGFLYIGMGDGGSAGSPHDYAQNKNVLLGKLLRINVDMSDGNKPYGIPDDNPFAGDKKGKPEIWAYGLRNPWRFSFDAKTGDLYIADVGQYKWEWVHFQPSGSEGGQNYGWDILEGFHEFEKPEGFDISQLTLPVVEYSHDKGCSITGGYVYRGKKFTDIEGTYFFGDFCSGTIWGLRKSENSWEWANFLESGHQISSFGVDSEGEIYVLSYRDGGIYRIVWEGE